MSMREPPRVRDACAPSAEAIEQRDEAPTAAIDRHEEEDTGTHDALTEGAGASTASKTSLTDGASSAEPAPDVDSVEASTGGTSGSTIPTRPTPTSEAGASSATEKESALVPTTGDEPSPPPPPPPPRRRRPLPPPPRKGILRPPSSSHAATARFSFRRDILQPFNSSYSRAGVAVSDHHPGSGSAAPPPPLVSERGAAAAAAVGEAVGNAAATAGGFFGNALKRLSAATAVAAGPVAHAATAAPDSEEAASRAVPSAETATSSASASVPTAASTSATSLASTSSSSSTLVPPSSAPAPPQPPPPPPPPPPTAPTHPLPISSLKQVRFRMASLRVVYPINNGTLDPIAPADEAQTRDRIEEEWRKEMGVRVAVENREPVLDHPPPAGKNRAEKEKGKGKDESQVSGGGTGGEEVKASRVYTGEELARVYAEACRTREEPGIERLRRFFRDNPKSLPKVLDLSHELLSSGAVAALSDILAIDWGCKKLVLDGCGLDDDALKPLLQSLLVSASIPTVSLAGNKRIRNRGWKYLAVFLRKATFLRYLDLSETSIDRKAAEWLVQAIAPQPTPQPPLQHDKQTVESENGESKKVPRVRGPWEEEDDSEDDEGPETTGSNLNKEDESASTEAKGDEEDEPLSAPSPKPPLFDSAPLLKEDWSGDGAAVQSLRLENCGLRGAGLEVLANGLRVSEVKHVSLRKNRINHAGGPYLAIMMRDYPLSADPTSAISSALNSPALSSPTIFRNGFSNGTTAANAPTPESPAATEGRNSLTAHRRHLFKPFEEGLHTLVAGKVATTTTETDHHQRENGEISDEGRQSPAPSGDPEIWRISEARTRLRRQIDALPRFGALLTLDVKGNDLRHGVTYVAQVLKRNRTLKTLNLSENKIDSHGLTAIAEALKYNSTLETLDMSHNPCCGPGVEGILALRSALMVSHSLKRIFLNSTELTSEGAIALAEFLPESRSVLHLDLTNNHIDISGVLALSVSIKLNSTIRCLDLNIPPNDPDFSRLSQDILNTCVRNTELAQEKADAEARRAADGSKRVVVAQPIRKSALASTLEERQRAEERREQRRQETLRSQQDILAAAAETRDVVRELLSVDEAASAKGVIVRPSEVVRDALVQLQLAEAQLAEAAPTTRQGEEREQAEALLSELGSLLDLAKTLYDRPAAPPAAPVERLTVPPPAAAAAAASADEAPPSPTFSLVDSSDEEDDEDAQAGAEVAPPAANGAAQVHLDSLAIPASAAPSEHLTVPEQSAAAPSVRSPIESESRAMVAEESEVFRRGLALGVDDVSDEEDDEDRHRTSKNVMVDEGQVLKKSEVSGEELKKEILETPVQRSPRPSFSAEPEVTPRPRTHRRNSSSSSNAVDI